MSSDAQAFVSTCIEYAELSSIYFTSYLLLNILLWQVSLFRCTLYAYRKDLADTLVRTFGLVLETHRHKCQTKNVLVCVLQ